jgi:hypothetical protein
MIPSPTGPRQAITGPDGAGATGNHGTIDP